ncbi:UNVERIFIED_CONTAM: hypothetical protein RMT77_003471 [Armadillidium vulgare]
MEAYIPYSSPSTKPNTPWFNSACSRAIRSRDVTFRDCHRLETPESLATYISSHLLMVQLPFFLPLKLNSSLKLLPLIQPLTIPELFLLLQPPQLINT